MSRSNFMPLSDEDEDFANFSLEAESPKSNDAHQQNSNAEGGHFYAGHHSTAGMRAAQRRNQTTTSSPGAFEDALARGPGANNNMQDTLQALKTKSLSLAALLKEKATQAGSSVADPASRQQTLSRFKMWGAGAAERVQHATAQGWQQARDLTSEGVKRLYGGPLAAICKLESSQRPCPRAIIICCTAIVTNGLYAEGIFKEDAPDELVHYLLGAFEEGQGLCLPPPGTDPIVVAAALKQFLLTLPEPLFSHKCMPAIIAAGQEAGAQSTPEALSGLPPASLNALTLLLEMWHRIAEQSAANGMDARALAVAVTPCLAWAPPMAQGARKDYMTIGVPEYDDGGSWRRGAANQPDSLAEEGGGLGHSDLEPHDLAAVISVVEYAITHFRGAGSDFDGPLYDYGSSPPAPPEAASPRPASQPAAEKAKAGEKQQQQPDLLPLAANPPAEQQSIGASKDDFSSLI